jgi:hypothetical protein
MKDPKTTVLGVLGIIGGLVSIITSIVNGTSSSESLGVGISAILAGIGNFFSRDAKKEV